MVLSDNLVGTLSVRPDTMLMGSFLMSDVLEAGHPGNPAVRRFVDHERELLSRHRPPMICVEDVVMAGVRLRTDAVEVGWMCDLRATRRRVAGDPTVAVLIGRTGAADAIADRLIPALGESGYHVALPRRPEWKVEHALDGGATFDHSSDVYAGVAVAVCRPGLGTVHDCVSNRIPMVLVREPGNIELEHNARRIGELGLGIDAGEDPDAGAVLQAIQRAHAMQADIRSRQIGLRFGGISEAALWLERRMAWV